MARGLVAPVRPDRLLGMALALARYGMTPASGYAAAAARNPDGICLIDDEGRLTFREVDVMSDAVAHALRARGVEDGLAVGVLCRNGRAAVIAFAAVAKAGADAVLLNTGLSSEATEAVVSREKIAAVVVDLDLVDLVGDAGGRPLIIGWTGGGEPPRGALTMVEALERYGPRGLPRKPGYAGREIILTSGTTGAPKGAPRNVEGIEPFVSVLSSLPVRANGTTVVAAPVFHAWGLAQMSVAMLLGSTVVLRRKFDPMTVVADAAAYAAETIVAVPVMLQRLLEVPKAERDAFDLHALTCVAVSGSAVGAPLAIAFQEAYGPVLHNFYGSTEVALATCATPEDLLADPGCAGRVLPAVVVKILDAERNEVAKGEIGTIFVGSAFTFGGYTNGADKDRVAGLVSSGDLGRFDAQDRLHVLGRDDDMIVSGGENVFPQPVEDVINDLPGVTEVSVVGVPDKAFGQRLVAFVVADGSLDAAAVKATVKARVTSFSVPRDVVFLPELPRNATGKVLKRELVTMIGSTDSPAA